MESDVSDQEWDAFVRSRPGGNVEQTSAWARLKGQYGWSKHRFVLRVGGSISAGAQVLVRSTRRLGKIGLISRGPLVASDDPVLANSLWDQVEAFARREKMAYFVVVPSFCGPSPEVEMRERGFMPKPDSLPPSNMTTATPVLDLSPSLETIHMGMRKGARRSIKKALQAPARFLRGGSDDVEQFRLLMCQLCERRGVAPAPPERDFFENAWRELVADDLVRVYMLEIDGRTVSATFVFTFNDWFLIWKGGWSGEFIEYCPNHLLYWEMIKAAKEEGFRYFEQVQILPEHAHAIARGEKPTGDYAGVTLFKMGFGGEILFSPPVMMKSYRPWLQAALKAGGARLLASSNGRKWTQKLLGRGNQ